MKVIQKQIKTVDYYKFTNLESLKIGNNIAYDIFIKKDNNYIIIIEAGTFLTEQLYAKLQKQTSLYIFKKDKDKTQLTCKTLKYYIKYNKNNFSKRVSFIYSVNTQLFNNYLENPYNKIDLECVNLIVESILYLVKYDSDFLKNTIPYFKDEHNLSNHSLHVAMYAMNLGNDLSLDTENLLHLATAGLLHDLGLKKVDDLLIYKKEKLNINELEEIHKHVNFSVEILKQNNFHTTDILDAVLGHHELYNGKGYPNNLEEGEIGQFASILAICDVFDALTSNRPHRKQYTSFEAIKMMFKDDNMINNFNHHYLSLLLKAI
nr:HD domain-containing phosphohydrolase [uncultured Sulfurimonas sp.]